MSTPDPENELLRPSQAAEMFGVRTRTISRWAREGRLSPLLTPGGHRRYSRNAIRQILEEQAQASIPDDAVGMYDDGWSIRQVAEKYGVTYRVMHSFLKRHTTLRGRGSGRHT